jgi:hypothetical protein
LLQLDSKNAFKFPDETISDDNDVIITDVNNNDGDGK